MTDAFSMVLAQFNPTVGALDDNAARIAAVYARHADRADLVVFPEMALSGYPAEDLVCKPFFLSETARRAETLAQGTTGRRAGLLLGAPVFEGGAARNAALLLADGRIVHRQFKYHLPNYGVFDEARIFASGPLPAVVAHRGMRLGVLICEDMWFSDTAAHLARQGAEILLALNGSPFEEGKTHLRRAHAAARVQETVLPLVYLNQVGGQDELVFDGASFALTADGAPAAQMASHAEDETVLSWRRQGQGWKLDAPARVAAVPDGPEAVYRTLMLGLRDYVDKNRFAGVALGLSGGIDSALSAAIAVDALGPSRVRGFMLPSPYTSAESRADAAESAQLLNLTFQIAPIDPAMQALAAMLETTPDVRAAGVVAENIQARARGLFLMAVSNATGTMLLSTGNKSELAVGYATLYGDMCGGYNVLKDVYKTAVFALARWRNAHPPADGKGPSGRAIPERSLTRPPSAELRPDQKDEDTLPPYAVLDDILFCLIERDMAVEEIVARGHARATVLRVWALLDRAEYKRRQACPGVKISSKAFGRDRRYPITNRFVGEVEGV